MKCIAKIWNPKTREYEDFECEILHWGVTYEELNQGVGHYTVVWVKNKDGNVLQVHPSDIKIIEN